MWKVDSRVEFLLPPKSRWEYVLSTAMDTHLEQIPAELNEYPMAG